MFSETNYFQLLGISRSVRAIGLLKPEKNVQSMENGTARFDTAFTLFRPSVLMFIAVFCLNNNYNMKIQFQKGGLH